MDNSASRHAKTGKHSSNINLDTISPDNYLSLGINSMSMVAERYFIGKRRCFTSQLHR